jgi:hypothetical protein
MKSEPARLTPPFARVTLGASSWWGFCSGKSVAGWVVPVGGVRMAEKIVIRPLDKKETTGDSNSQGA